MSKRLRLSISPDRIKETDWFKCFICQIDKEEALMSPSDPADEKKSGYTLLARNIPEFKSLNEMPAPLDIRRIDDGSGIEETLIRNSAKYHHSCRIMFNNTKLDRARKRRSCDSADGNESSKFMRRKASQEQEHNTAKCFLCEEEGDISDLRKAMTMQLNDSLNRCASNLQDKELLAKLSAGDVVAQEFKYHCKCLTALYNRERKVLKERETPVDKDRVASDEELAFAELITHIVESQRSSPGGIAFKLADLCSLYEQRLFDLSSTTTSINRTKLKERILSKLPDLQAYHRGREVVLVFEKDIGPAIVTACEYTDALHLAKAADIVRKDMMQHKVQFNGSFSSATLAEAVPNSLLELVSMVEHGPDIESQLENGIADSDFAIAQLLLFNFHKKATKNSTVRQKHSSEREPPFAVYVGLLLFAKTRKRNLIDTLFQHGLCISYDRVLEISTRLGDSAIQQYLEEGVVCPAVLQKGIFTTTAVDNIDHNPSSTTSMSSFHGTGISVFQHPKSTDTPEPRDLRFLQEKPTSKKVSNLPETYTNIPPAFLKTKPTPPTVETPVQTPDQEYLLQNLRLEYDWLQHFSSTQDVSDTESVSWSSHHASQERGPKVEVSTSSLLPLLPDQAHSVSTIKHAMDKVKEVTEFLNPTQTPVITADQPLFVLAKQIQWQWPDKYGEDKFVIMFGGLHIEMASFKLLGDLLKGSGWVGALTEAGVSSSGTSESFLTASNVAKTRQVHQITACCLYELMKEAFVNSIDRDDLNIEEVDVSDVLDWCSMREKECPQFQFWGLILNLELLVLSFIRSYREADFKLYTESLSALIPFFFALDHMNYARWLPIHLRDMLSLESCHPRIFAEFSNGNFAVRKTESRFSCIAIDQAHEQNNAVVKGDGGAIGLTEDPSALRRWMIAGPEISRLVDEFTASSGKVKVKKSKHHEETQSSQKQFFEKVVKLRTVFSEMGNPFEDDSTDLYAIDSKDVADIKVSGSMQQLSKLGERQYKRFLESMSDANKSGFYDPIVKNKLPLFSTKTNSGSKSVRTKLASLKEENNLFSRLFISCQSRQCDLEDFFRHENQNYPPSLSHDGGLYHGTKSELVPVLEHLDKDMERPEKEPPADTLIIDGAALVHTKIPGASKTFDEYAKDVILPHVENCARNHRRIDIVFDVYYDDSLKGEAREKRGSGGRRKVTGNSRPPKSWYTFLRCDENKTELFRFLAEKLSDMNIVTKIVATVEENVVSNQQIDVSQISPCNHEEADTRMFLHVKDAAMEGSQEIMIVSTDTDVVVIGVALYQELDVEKLWISFGKEKVVRWIPLHEISRSLGPRAKALPFFHALTGCDTVSAFLSKGKKSCWRTWDVYPEATETFTRLSSPIDNVTDVDMRVIEEFVVIMYDRSSSTDRVDEARFDLFARRQKPYNSIPPSRAALVQHVKRSVLQAGHTWGQSLNREMQLPSPESWGWHKEETVWVPYWTSLSPIASSCQQLVKCGCKRNCSGNCKCYRSGFQCTALCNCTCEET